MTKTTIRLEADFRPPRQFRTGVSLHGHTLHSKETLVFFYPMAKNSVLIRKALEHGEKKYREIHGAALDLTKAWWTPPLAAYDAWALETKQIREGFGLESLVSLTDHDDIEGPMNLQLRDECRPAPVSVEWTIPYRRTFFHIGVHNLPADCARALMVRLTAVTNGTAIEPLRSLFEDLAANRDTLIVFNHPNWDENGIGNDEHRGYALEFAAAYQSYIHAFELNGLRPAEENRSIFDLAKAFDKPLISGGDRHGIEPNTVLNLTNAATFPEFAGEVREGHSDVFITKQYMEPFAGRILQNVNDVLCVHENHAYGWKHWSDRAFFLCADGITRSLTEVLGDWPLPVRLFTRGLGLMRHPQFKNAFRMAFARREEVIL